MDSSLPFENRFCKVFENQQSINRTFDKDKRMNSNVQHIGIFSKQIGKELTAKMINNLKWTSFTWWVRLHILTNKTGTRNTWNFTLNTLLNKLFVDVQRCDYGKYYLQSSDIFASLNLSSLSDECNSIFLVTLYNIIRTLRVSV